MTTTNVGTEFERFLGAQDEGAWGRAVAELLPSIHEVDRNATQIWFAFYPLALADALARADDADALARKLLLQGNYRLRDQIDSSHKFLYGHRHWPEIKRSVAARADSFAPGGGGNLTSEIRAAAADAASTAKVDASLVLGVTAAAFMTVRQAGLAAFKSSPGEVRLDRKLLRRSPEDVLRERARDDSQGPFGFLRTTDKQWTVTWDESDPTARFKMMSRQEIASAAPNDRRDWSQVDPRCTVDEGPIPVQCRSASCGTCWVGVLGGAEKLSPVHERERKVLRLSGYADSDEPRPLVRLSCQAQGEGAVSIVIPPWNGVFGKHLLEERRRQESGEGGDDTAATAQQQQ